MTPWRGRPIEERTLLNPAFCSILLWHSARGHAINSTLALSIEEAFVVLPLVLPMGTRQSLPATVKTSIPVWVDENPIQQRRIAERAQAASPFTRTALAFGGVHGLFQFEGSAVNACSNWSADIKKALNQASDEVRNCAKKAEFVGKWFARTGPSNTVLALLGVRP